MVDLEDLGERRQTNHTPTIALGVAAFLLLIVGALSYKEAVRSSLEKEYAEKERDLMMRHGYVPYPAGQGVPNPAQANAAPTNEGQAPRFNQTPGRVAAPGEFSSGNNSAQGGAAGFQQSGQRSDQPASNGDAVAANGIENALPEPVDPELESIRSSLEQVREQSERTDQRYREITGDVDRRAREAADATVAAASEGISDELPEFLREAVESPPGGNPSVQERLGRLREQVRKAPSLAQVTGYDKDWGIVTFNAGSAQNVQKDQRFAVRRGSEILGWVKVDEVQPNQSIAVLVTKNRDIDTALKPEVGDDLIDFELF